MSEKITDLIKKLLRLARDKSATPAEAAQALNRAMDLAEKHAIDTAALDLDEISEKIVREDVEIGARVTYLKRRASSILINYFKVEICLVTTSWPSRSVTMALVGFESDVTIAQYVFDYVTRTCSKSLSEFSAREKKARRVVNDKKKKAYVHGWMTGLAQNLRRPEAQETLGDSGALVLVKRAERVKQFFEELFPDAKTTKRKAENVNHKGALSSGYLAGKDTTINTAIAGCRPDTLFLE